MIRSQCYAFSGTKNTSLIISIFFSLILLSCECEAFISTSTSEHNDRFSDRHNIKRSNSCRSRRPEIVKANHNRLNPLFVSESANNEITTEAPSTKSPPHHNSITLTPIGVVQSVYSLCVGTPRQGLLAPHARGRIYLDNLCDGGQAKAAVEGLEGFSHVWIVFLFHLNADDDNTDTNSSSTTTNGNNSKSKTKIAPPALGGKRVGVLATRSPHRYNPVGMTLAQLDGVRTVREYEYDEEQQTHSHVLRTYLDISGLDLVDGTPVLDVKPYVPVYDAPLAPTVPGGSGGSSDDDTTSTSTSTSTNNTNGNCRVPSWVADGLATQRPVDISDVAQQELSTIMTDHPTKLEFYGNRAKKANTGSSSSFDFESEFAAVKACIVEVLAVDVRSRWQTKKARGDNVNKAKPNTRKQQIDNLLIHFQVQQVEAASMKQEASSGSGAEDKVVVTRIELADSSYRG